MSRARPIHLLALACLALVLPASAEAGSLYGGAAPRPGPDVLYQPPATAPQLANAGVWQADPILISGASAYRDGEFLYQDFLYDDHGANGTMRDPSDPRLPGHVFSQANGTYLYPSDPIYRNNAADLVELRVKPLADATAFRLTLNTMRQPSLVAATIAIGGSPTLRQFPYHANVRAPARYFLTVHGQHADLRDARTGTPILPAPSATVDLDRRQIEVVVPHAAWDPGRQSVRLAAGVGLWDSANARYLLPQTTSDASHPGGAGTLAQPPAFFNVAFRFDERWPDVGDLQEDTVDSAWWRDKRQGHVLAGGTLTPFRARVDFAKLEDGVDDDSIPGEPGGVPQTGPMDRILASHHEVSQGVDYAAACLLEDDHCPGEYRGRLQPYAIYVPPEPMPPGGYGMTLLLHSLTANYNQYSNSRNQAQFGDRGPGSIVITPEARGPDGGYDSYAAADVFEVWADVASRYPLDPAWTVIAGYSMGGIGTFKLAEQFPDLFSRAQPTVGDSSETGLLPSLRNIPVLMWNGASDELVNPALYLPTAQGLDDLGYRYELDVFVPGEHNSLAYNDQYAPAAKFLGTAKVDRNPAHVTFAVDPGLDRASLDLVADHAYWLSGVRTRNGALGTIDAFSHAFGRGDPTASATQYGAGVLTGGNLPAYPFSRQYVTWGPPPQQPVADRLDLDADGVRELTVHVVRAGLDCDVDVHATTDGPLLVHLAGCGTDLQFP